MHSIGKSNSPRIQLVCSKLYLHLASMKLRKEIYKMKNKLFAEGRRFEFKTTTNLVSIARLSCIDIFDIRYTVYIHNRESINMLIKR